MRMFERQKTIYTTFLTHGSVNDLFNGKCQVFFNM